MGMYPENKRVAVFGEEVAWPGVDEKTGKFTNGDFSDPMVRPSFIPAETVNLILDNLASLIERCGGEPDAAGPAQLAALLSELAEPRKLALRDAGGRAKFAPPIEADDAARLAEVAAIEEQVGSPGGIASLDADGRVPREQLPEMFPVGSCYTQYPVAGQAAIAGMFPEAESPASLFGGTWTDSYLEDVFFRTGPTLGARRGQHWGNGWTATGVPGLEIDAIRNITGTVAHWRAANSAGAGAFWQQHGFGNGCTGTNAGSQGRLDVSLVVPTDTTNHPRNRLIKVWKRTA